MSDTEYDFIVVGLGVTGLYTSYILCKNGFSVIGFEADDISGEYPKPSSIETAMWIPEPNIEESLEHWRNLQQEWGHEQFIFPTGGCFVKDVKEG